MATQAQIEALKFQIETGKLATDKAKIANYIKNNPFCSRIDIVEALSMHEYTVGGRLSDLEDMGFISTDAVKSKVQRGSKQSTYYYLDNEEARDVMRRLRHTDKLLIWVKKGLNDFGDELSIEAKAEMQNLLEKYKPLF